MIVNNGARLDVLPTAGEENVYGGLFRQAEIIVTEPAAIGFDGYGGCGVLLPRNVRTRSGHRAAPQ